ncbi:MurR/RpiR family transcriptional regulator [Virgibacillus pantothenticus]|uniref:MurR/RpiR family transcriptional regulator n=1 Tax=Virgibacillus pantothenticus TaxID=1473 RepID=UPI0025B0F3D8|nr:MurR/RpiR family transcriptional regulator [Virgibacillus pantothenticus]
MDFHERILKYEYKLNDTDDQIIEYILSHKQEVTNLTIQNLANKLYTVPNTIMRLSKKIGYEGYSHLKNSLKEELKTAKIQDENSSYYFIKKTIDLIDEEVLLSVARIIKEAKLVLFYAVGDNTYFCDMMVKNLRMVERESRFYLHRHENIHQIQEMGEKDLLFLISLSGKTPQVLEMTEKAKERGVQTVSLTHFYHNPLQEKTAINLYCYSPKEIMNGYNVTDHTPLMIILQALSRTYWELG